MANPQSLAPTWINIDKPLEANHLPGNLHAELGASNEDFPNVQTVFQRNNRLYFIGENLATVFDRLYEMWTDNGTGGQFWSKVDNASRPQPHGIATGLEASWTQGQGADSGIIYGVWLSVNFGPVQKWYMQNFNMDTNTWGPILLTNGPLADQIGNIVVRKDGSFVVFYRPNGNTGRNTLFASFSVDGVNWTGPIDVGVNGDQTGATNIVTRNVSCYYDSGTGIIHCSFHDGAAFVVGTYQQILPNNTLGPFLNFSSLPGGGAIGQLDDLVGFYGNLVQVVQFVNFPNPGTFQIGVWVWPIGSTTFASFLRVDIFSVVGTTFTFPTHSKMSTDNTSLVVGVGIQNVTVPIAQRFSVMTFCVTNDAAAKVWSAPQVFLDPTAAPVPLTAGFSNPAVWIGQVINDMSLNMSPFFRGLIYAILNTVCLNSNNVKAAFMMTLTGLVPTTPIIPTPNIPIIPIPAGGGGPGPGGNPSDGGNPGSGGPGGSPGDHNPGGKGPWSAGWWCCFLCDQPKWTKLKNPIVRSKSLPYARRTKHV